MLQLAIERLTKTQHTYSRHNAPKAQLHGDPSIGAQIFANELRWELGAEECEFEDGVAHVHVCKIVNTIGRPQDR